MIERKHTRIPLEVLCCLVYFTSYITRTNYGAVMSELIPALDLTKSLASMAVTGSFVTYGLGQLFCGWLGDRVQPRQMISFGLFCTALCNLIMPNLSNPYVMAALWSFNGFFQSMLWPPLVRMMADHLSSSQYARATVSVNAMASIGTICVYLLTPVCITVADWHSVFLLPAAFGLFVTVLWTISTRSLDSAPRAVSAQSSGDSTLGLGKIILLSALPVTIVSIILQGLIRDGVTTWMPIYLTESFGIPNEFSILISSILPLFSILGIFFASRLDKAVGNEVRSACFLFALASVCGLLLIPLWNKSILAVLLLFSVLYAAICGINLMLISRLPQHFLSYGCVAVISGLLNAFTYVGSSLSSFGIGHLVERFDWQFILGFWTAAALFGMCLTFLTIGKWNLFTQVNVTPKSVSHPSSDKLHFS